MMPSSHRTLKPLAFPGKARLDNDLAATAVHEIPLSCGEPAQGTHDASPGHHALLLSQAFSEFIATSQRLEVSYRGLQQRVNLLTRELAERNAALQSSQREKEAMRLTLQQVVDSMPCGVLVVDREGCVETINPESASLLGIDAEARPLTLLSVMSKCGVQLDTEWQGDSEREVCLRRGHEERWLQVRTRCLSLDAAAPAVATAKIFILRDVTSHKRAEHDREAGRNALALAEITTMLAHEIRNPLASLELFAELIEQDDERRGEWISNLRAGVRSLSGTVNNVLTFHSTRPIKLSPIFMGGLIDEALRFVQPLADQSGVTVRSLNIASDVQVMAHEGAIRQVLLNVLSNAIRHTRPAGVITLTMRHDAGQPTRIECTDTGEGLDEKALASIFTAGYSGSGDTPGMGLAVCERIMRQHGGAISAMNVQPQGARFVLEFSAPALGVHAA